MSQDEGARRGAMESMEKQVIRLATAKTGPVLMPEQIEPEEAAIMFQDSQAFAVGVNCYVPAMQYSACWIVALGRLGHILGAPATAGAIATLISAQGAVGPITYLATPTYPRRTLWQDHLGHAIGCSWQR